MDAESAVRDYYRGDDLEGVALDVLSRAGADVNALTVEDLAGLDQLHAGSREATQYVLGLLDLDTDTTLIDLGCGVGGPARIAANTYGCRVTGVDLSDDFIAVARALTERVGLSALVAFEVGSATALQHPDGSFERALMVHAGMNIEDKAAVFGEVRRVLVPGGLFAIYDQMRLGEGELSYPLPWADDDTSSFVETRDGYARLLSSAGFRVEHDEDRTPALAAAGPPPDGSLGPGELFSRDFTERLGNHITAAMAGTLGAVVMVVRAV